MNKLVKKKNCPILEQVKISFTYKMNLLIFLNTLDFFLNFHTFLKMSFS